jgi:glycosyltransferase involved in cell wall biosynthesis
MKIIHLVRLYNPHVGGIEKHLEKINKILIDKGHSVTVITQQYKTNLALKETVDGVSVIRLVRFEKDEFNKNKTLYKLKTWSEIYKNIKTLINADVIHVHDVFWWLLPFYFLFLNKTYITFHGYEGNNSPKLNQIFWHKLANILTKGNICVGGFHNKWYKVNPTITTFGAVKSLSNNSVYKKNIFKISKKSKNQKIIFIGRLADDNGISNYLKSLKVLKSKGYDYSLDVYGDGPLLKKSREFVKENKLKVVFHGAVNNAQQFLPQYDLAFISRYLGILEALSARVFVIAQYNNQIKKDYLKLSPFGEWIDIVSSESEIADAVLDKQNLTEENLKDLTKSQQWANIQTWEKMTENYLKLWQI